MVATTLKKVELSWDDVAAGNFPENSTRRLWRESVGDIAERAKATLPEACNGRIEKAVQIVLSGDVVQMADGRAVVGSQADTGVYYVVNGECNCKDSDRPEIEGWCKHKIAAAILKRATELDNERLEQDKTKSQTAVTTSLPEAPASANVYVEIAGRKVQVTLRDENEESLLVRMQRLLEKFPANDDKPTEGWCATHNLQMKRHTNEKGSWWSHKTDDGWCRGK